MNRLGRRSLLSTLGAAAAGSIISPFVSLARPSRAAEIAQPGYLIPTTDTKFGSRIVKVTNPNHEVPGLGLTWGNVAIHHYSIDQAWNADQTILALDRGTKPKVFLDGSTYQPLLALAKPGDARWHPRRPEEMIFTSRQSVGLWKVRRNEIVTLKTFSEYDEASFGDHKGNPSDDGRMIAITATRHDGKRVVFAYDLESGQKYPDIDMSSEHDVGHTTISPGGALIVVYSLGNKDAAHRHRRVFTRNGELLQTWTDYERPGHGDFAIDRNGDEVLVGRSKSGLERWRIIARRLIDGQITVLSPKCYASHVSARNLQDRNWIFATFSGGVVQQGFVPYRGEIGAVSMDGNHAIRRLVQTHAEPGGYLTEPHACPSPDGRRVIFASNWGNKTGPIAAYVAELP